MNKEILRRASGPALAVCAAVIGGCGGGGRHDHGGGGVPYTSSSYSYVASIGTTGQLLEPDAIAVDTKGYIYVANYASSGTPNIAKFDPTGNYLFSYGNTGTVSTGLLKGPQGIYVDPAGNSYVSDAISGQVVVFNSSNKFKGNLLSGQIGTYPYQITADAAGDLYVASSDLAEILKFNALGNILNTLGSSTLNSPGGVAVDSSGNVYVTDYGNSDVVEYSSTGQIVKTFGNTGPYRLRGPQGITVNPTYGIFVADLSNNFVYHYDLNGNFIETVGSPSGAGALLQPYDVTVSPSGSLLVVDSGDNRVVEFTAQTPAAKKSSHP